MNGIQIRPIRNDDDLASALGRIEALMNSVVGSTEADELEVLAQLVESYEDRHWPIEAPTAVAAIKFRMEQQGLCLDDLAFIGSRGTVARVLSGERRLTLKMIRALHERLGIPAEVLLNDPEPVREANPFTASGRTKLRPSMVAESRRAPKS